MSRRAYSESETVTLISDQTTTLARSYPQLGDVTVTLTPASGQWRIDGGAWRNGGTTATKAKLDSTIAVTPSGICRSSM